MFPLSEMRVVTQRKGRDQYFGFVGVRRNPGTRQIELWLPHGFDDFPQGDYRQVVRTFFQLYQSLRVYERRSPLQPNRGTDREPLTIDTHGYQFAYDSPDPPLTFAKLHFLEAVLGSFDELEIASLLARPALRPPETLAAVFRFLDRAIYNPDNSFFLDAIPSERKHIEYSQTDLVCMFCYLHLEILKWISDDDDLSPALVAAAAAFKEEFLPEAAALFEESTFDFTLGVLRDVLERIHRNVAYRDEDYWRLYDACEAFLYGEVSQEETDDGILFGVRDFSSVWEDMGHVYLREVLGPRGRKVLFADSLRHHVEPGSSEVAFHLQLHNERQYRQLAPDLVLMADAHAMARDGLEQAVDVRYGHLRNQIYDKVTISSREDRGESYLYRLDSALRQLGGFRREHHGNSLVLYRIPAGVIRRIIDGEIEHRAVQGELYVIDFKYHPYSDFAGVGILPDKIISDIRKQLVYELGLRAWLDQKGDASTAVKSQFAIPYFSPKEREFHYFSPEPGADRPQHDDVRDAGIEVYGLPFERVADFYIRCA